MSMDKDFQVRTRLEKAQTTKTRDADAGSTAPCASTSWTQERTSTASKQVREMAKLGAELRTEDWSLKHYRTFSRRFPDSSGKTASIGPC
ncbi:uncharacterized protein PpBr36_06141 [Pyricularia pennisetigena]|uniref:uncharacterized protein n=1 Tax=Pyricularia pennisetigena TaxID=1578925 RepID=UPI0011522EAC|nr:uncharacterized protein PpBr36_06141 [Pyricularia pennisetigena]TLS23177.1 hypothetical protein PpBr36_06141 [Pyricularia pennisetigena]